MNDSYKPVILFHTERDYLILGNQDCILVRVVVGVDKLWEDMLARKVEEGTDIVVDKVGYKVEAGGG